MNELNPDKTEVLLVGSSSVLGCECTLMYTKTALTPKPSAHSLGVLRDPALLFHEQNSTAVKSVR